MSLVSVVIPVFNGEGTIYETVNSVLEQTLQDIELIVINDGSQDATVDILDKIGDQRLQVYSYPNAGLSASRNRGIKLSHSQLISFLDADDLWTPDKLSDQYDALCKHPEAAVAYSMTEFVDEEGKRLGYGIQHTADGYIFQDLLVNFFIGSGSNALFRRSVFDEVGGFDESLIAAEDWDMILRLAARYQFVAVRKAQILYRIVENSMSSNVLRQEKESLKVIRRAYSEVPGDSMQHLQKYTYANLYFYLAGRALRGTPSSQKGLIATKFLCRSLANNPRILMQVTSISILILKIATAIMLPPQQALAFRTTLKSLAKYAR